MQEAGQTGDLGLFDRVALNSGQVITGPSSYLTLLKNSLIIAGSSTFFAVVLGLFAAYAFSRFPVKGKDDLMFFILSTRMLPAVVVNGKTKSVVVPPSPLLGDRDPRPLTRVARADEIG